MQPATREQILNCSDFNQLLNTEYGKRGTQTREQFEAEAEAFVFNAPKKAAMKEARNADLKTYSRCGTDVGIVRAVSHKKTQTLCKL